MGESKLKQAQHEEMLMSCTGVQTMAGRGKCAGRRKAQRRRWGNWPTSLNFSI